MLDRRVLAAEPVGLGVADDRVVDAAVVYTRRRAAQLPEDPAGRALDLEHLAASPERRHDVPVREEQGVQVRVVVREEVGHQAVRQGHGRAASVGMLPGVPLEDDFAVGGDFLDHGVAGGFRGGVGVLPVLVGIGTQVPFRRAIDDEQVVPFLREHEVVEVEAGEADGFDPANRGQSVVEQHDFHFGRLVFAGVFRFGKRPGVGVEAVLPVPAKVVRAFANPAVEAGDAVVVEDRDVGDPFSGVREVGGIHQQQSVGASRSPAHGHDLGGEVEADAVDGIGRRRPSVPDFESRGPAGLRRNFVVFERERDGNAVEHRRRDAGGGGGRNGERLRVAAAYGVVEDLRGELRSHPDGRFRLGPRRGHLK